MKILPVMKKYLLLGLVILSAATFVLMRQNAAIRRDNDRLLHNNTVLNAGLETYRTSLGQSAAHVGRLEMTIKELREYNDSLLLRMEQMELKPRRAESMSITAVNTAFRFTVPLERETIREHRNEVRTFRWDDPWNSINGIVANDSVQLSLQHTDTLDQVIYRVPRRFLFIRWGTKEIRQVVSTRDPKSRIIYSEYIVLKRKK